MGTTCGSFVSSCETVTLTNARHRGFPVKNSRINYFSLSPSLSMEKEKKRRRRRRRRRSFWLPGPCPVESRGCQTQCPSHSLLFPWESVSISVIIIFLLVAQKNLPQVRASGFMGTQTFRWEN
ncbi:hypothetical protein AA313_de0210054 [Arthrobotrys entomopaga]|nr:hypothetical protein AA313_de0210054 [Arthrobotrys entomopaga]